VAQDTLPTLVSEKEDWESQLTRLESQLTRLKSELAQAVSLLNRTAASFPESVESIEYDERLFKIADNWNLEITTLTASEPTDKVVEDITYSVTSFAVDVRGEVANILDFINAIVTSEDFTCATAELVNINVPELLTGAEKEAITKRFTGGLLEELAKEDLTEIKRKELLKALAEALAAAEEEIEELEMPSASIRLVIYGYKGE